MNKSISYIQSHINFTPETGIILGTGLGDLVSHVDIRHELSYADIPDFPTATVETHKGKLIFGMLNDHPVVVMQGRFHYYEGYDMKQITMPVRAMKQLGIKKLMISNISGGLNPDFKEGDIMIIKDHINLLPDNPLRGPNDESMGPRFPDMLHAYDPEMVEKAYQIGIENDYRINKGVYVSIMGPNLETPAEYKFLRTIGADSVGMSTVPEVIVARHMGLPVFAASIVTDMCIPGSIEPADIHKIIGYANEGQPKISLLFKSLL